MSFQVYPGALYNFVERSNGAYTFYVTVHLLFYSLYSGGLLVWYRMADLNPLEVLKEFADESDFANASCLFAFPRDGTMEAILWSLAAVMAVLFA